MPERPFIIATRGSALALAQANAVFDQCRKAFPKLRFELKIITTKGDKLQTAANSRKKTPLPKGLFTKELEVALLRHHADLAVHSLKDLPTELPAGLKLGAVCKRADWRDVLIYRDAAHLKKIAAAATLTDWSPGQAERRGMNPKSGVKDLPAGWNIATGSPRRKAQLLALRPDIHVVEIRGNVPTRLQRLDERADIDALILAAAGFERLHFEIKPDGRLVGDAVPDGLLAIPLTREEMLPCVGQGAIGIETRALDERVDELCVRLNHYNTFQAVTAERAFLNAMGGGCLAPVAALAETIGEQIQLRAVSYQVTPTRRTELKGHVKEAQTLGELAAAQLKP